MFSPVSKYQWIVAFLCMTRADLYTNISRECSKLDRKERFKLEYELRFFSYKFLKFHDVSKA